MTVPFLQAVQPPTITVKIKKAVPFLSVRPSAISVRVMPQFPAALVGGTGISVRKQQGVFTIDLDVEKLQAVATGSNSYIILWDSVAKQFSRITLSDLKTLMGL